MDFRHLFGSGVRKSSSQRLLSALGVSLYGMFLAVILPPARKNKVLMGIILVSMGASLLFASIPVLSGISSGFKIIILTLVIAGGAAFLFPVKEEEKMHSAFGYIAVMAVVTYLIRMIPLVLLKKEITNTWVKSFLYYVPYVTLAVMTFPAILEATDSLISGAAALAAAVVLAYKGKSLIQVAAAACAAVFVLELFLVR